MNDRSYICTMRRKKISELELLDVGLDLLWEQGYCATGVKQIAERAGILPGSFYNYYPGKAAFVNAVLEHYWVGWEKILRASIGNSALSSVDGFRRLFDSATERYTAHGFKRGCFAGRMTHELADLDAGTAEKLEELFGRAEAYYVNALTRARDSGQLKATLPVADLASYALNAFEGALLRIKSSRDARPLTLCRDHLINYLFHQN